VVFPVPGFPLKIICITTGLVFSWYLSLNCCTLIKAERADLVGEYIGQTAQKTKKLLERALGGVLFIDEAYSLARGGEKDFGKESIDTIVKAMEDYKDKLIIILAGYRDEMNFFLRTNPGLASRFAIQIDFPDYTIDELVQIANLMYKEREYILDEKSKHYIYRILSEIRNKEIINGNARTVRNLVERSIRQHARRIIKQKNISKKDLIYITKEDLIGEEGNNEKMPCNRDA
ncbi:MAG: AAA family ATPase, partial [Halanaerobiales bacterium]